MRFGRLICNTMPHFVPIGETIVGTWPVLDFGFLSAMSLTFSLLQAMIITHTQGRPCPYRCRQSMSKVTVDGSKDRMETVVTQRTHTHTHTLAVIVILSDHTLNAILWQWWFCCRLTSSNMTESSLKRRLDTGPKHTHLPVPRPLLVVHRHEYVHTSILWHRIYQ